MGSMAAIDAVKLRDHVVDAFDIEELNGLMFELGIRRDEIDGGTIGTRAESLLDYCRRRGRLAELRDACARLRHPMLHPRPQIPPPSTRPPGANCGSSNCCWMRGARPICATMPSAAVCGR